MKGRSFLADMNARHRQHYLLYMIAALLMLLMSAVNVATNVLSSGQPVFIEHPWMGWLIAMLAPSASVALKTVPSALESERDKVRFVQALYLLTGIVGVIWLVSFSLTFTGVGSGIDWDDLGEGRSNAHGSFQVGSQLLLEILVGALLYKAADDIALIYLPQNTNPNPYRLQKQRDLAALEAERNAVMKEMGELLPDYTKLHARREADINQAVVAYWAARARQLPPESGNGQ